MSVLARKALALLKLTANVRSTSTRRLTSGCLIP